jgi:hypothetical protein
VTTRRTDFPSGGEVAPGPPAIESPLVPGGVVGDGRYRLLAQFGVDDRVNAQLWRARDGQLRRDVALTLLVGEPSQAAAAHAARRTLERAAHTARLSHPGMARVLDVLSLGNGVNPGEGLLGIVVADWSQGTDLIDLISDHPLPGGTAARLLEPLAGAVQVAHQSGLVLGIDHPQRIRVTPDGGLRLAFPAPLPESTLRDDVRGLGAILYLLLTGTWALPGGPAGLPPAAIGANGQVVPPSALRLNVPEELSVAAVRSLDETTAAGIRTSTTLIGVLERITEDDAPTEFIPPVGKLGLTGSVLAGADDDMSAETTVWTTAPPTDDKARKRKLLIGVSALGLATLAVLIWIGSLLVSFFSDDGTGTAGPTVGATSGPSPGAPPNASKPVPTGPIKPAGVVEYNIKGEPDNPKRANNSVDGNPKTSWKTSVYKQQFPTFKPGIGLIVSFAEPVKFATVAIDSPSEGTVVQVRSSPSDKPALDQTKVIGEATLGNGHTEIQLASSEPTQFVIIWITKLGNGNVSQLDEVGFVRAQ